MSTEAMKLARDALGLYARTLAPTETQKKGMEAITALDEALAQPQQEPVAWANPNDLQNFDMKVRTNAGPLHTVPLYTSPPARKPLTDEEIENLDCINALWDDGESCTIIGHKDFARAIEAAHGIKGDA